MTTADPRDIAARLRATASGEDPAVLIEALHAELRGMAGALFRGERSDHTLQPTALVSEACVRLLAGEAVGPMDRARFFALASKVMRHILIDHARAAGRDKRGGGRHRVTLGDPAGSGPTEVDLVDLLALDEALAELATLDERKARLVELRFFGGLSLDDSAKLLGVARSTASEDWRMARAWLLRRLRPDGKPGEGPA